MIRPLLILLAALVLAAPATAQPPADAANILTDVRILSADDMQGRAPGTAGSVKARAYIVKRFQEIGLKPYGGTFEQAFTISPSGTGSAEQIEGINLIGRIDGTDPAGKVIVVMAHYDHVGVRGGEIYNGADDNASGIGGLLAVAEAFARNPPKNTIIFAAVDAEEIGLVGSKYFVANPPVPLARIVLAINFDMLAKNAKNELWVAGATHFPYLRPRLEALAARAPVSLRIGHDTPVPARIDDWTNQSDHYAFHQAKVPWLYFGVEDHPEYHKPTDDFATVPQDFYRRSVLTVIAAVRALDNDLAAIAREAGR